jgi:predicted nucleic acid-binding protein
VRVLLDTNVIISGILFGGAPRQTINAALGEIELVTSPPLLAELERGSQSQVRLSFDVGSHDPK